MAITYPLTMPTIRIHSMRLIRTVAEKRRRSPDTFTTEVQVRDGQILMFEVVLNRMRPDHADIWAAFFDQLNGSEGTFLTYPYQRPQPKGAATGTPLVNGADQQGKILLTNGWTPEVSGILKQGDYISLGTGTATRLYRIAKDADSDLAGAAELDIWPSLRETPADNDAITTDHPMGIFRMSSNQYAEQFEPGNVVTGMNFSFEEAW